MVKDTSTYHIAYAVATIIYVSYVTSLWWRAKRANERLRRLRAESLRRGDREGSA